MPSRRKRLTKKEIKHDPVIETALTAWSYVLHNRTRVVGIGAGIVLLVVIMYGLTSYRSARGSDAETELARALFQLEANQRDVGVELLEELVAERGSTSAGKRAQYFLGQTLFEEGRFAEAKDHFEAFTGFRSDDPLLKASAAKGVADCLIELGHSAEAADAYLRVAATHDATPLTADCLYMAGLAFREADQRANAITALERLVEGFPTYARVGDARLLLGELQAVDQVITNESSEEVEG